MSEFEFPLLIASVDCTSQLSIPQQAQSFFASSIVKPSSPAIIISCFNSTSLLFPKLLNPSSSCTVNAPTSPGLWLRHVYQQDEQASTSQSTHRPRSLTKGAVASPARDDNSGTAILLLDVVATGLNQVCGIPYPSNLFCFCSQPSLPPPFLHLPPSSFTHNQLFIPIL
jgi:hypothetical protein